MPYERVPWYSSLKGQLNFIRVLTPILSLTSESRSLFIDEVEENGQVIFPGLVRLIDALIDDRLDEVYHDLAEHFSSPDGQLSPSDFKELKVESCAPLIIPFRDNEIIMPGLPTSAGALIAFGLELWSRSPVPSDLASFHQQFAAIASLTMDYRVNHFDPLLSSKNAVWDRDSIDFTYWEAQFKKATHFSIDTAKSNGKKRQRQHNPRQCGGFGWYGLCNHDIQWRRLWTYRPRLGCDGK